VSMTRVCFAFFFERWPSLGCGFCVALLLTVESFFGLSGLGTRLGCTVARRRTGVLFLRGRAAETPLVVDLGKWRSEAVRTGDSTVIIIA